MSTSLVHIGDTHLAPGPRNADRIRALDQIVTEGLALERLGAWLWPGDIFDAGSTIEDRNLVDERLQRMAARAPVVICYGNHDRAGDLDGFARLRAGFPIHVCDRPQCVRIRLATGEHATVFVLPYPTKAGLASLGVVPSDVVDVAGAALEHIFMHAAGELETAAAAGDLTLMIGHVNVRGSITSVGQPNIGREIEIGPNHLDRLGHIYKGLNHIHKGQEISGAFYPGSVCRLNWGEVEEKRYLVIDLQDDQDLRPAIFSRPVAVAPMYHIEGLLTREAFTWQVTAGPGGEVLTPPATWKGCEVRVRYKFNASERSVLDKARVLAEFAEAARLVLEPIAVPDRALRAPAVAAARTLADKVKAWGELAGVAADDTLLQKLAQLETRDPIVLVDQVQQELAALEHGQEATVAA